MSQKVPLKNSVLKETLFMNYCSNLAHRKRNSSIYVGLRLCQIPPFLLSLDICRVCRCEGSAERPLFHPCICTGSIKFIHQECLLQWLRYSKKEFCELCNHRFSFTPSMCDLFFFTQVIVSSNDLLFREYVFCVRAGLCA